MDYPVIVDVYSSTKEGEGSPFSTVQVNSELEMESLKNVHFQKGHTLKIKAIKSGPRPVHEINANDCLDKAIKEINLDNQCTYITLTSIIYDYIGSNSNRTPGYEKLIKDLDFLIYEFGYSERFDGSSPGMHYHKTQTWKDAQKAGGHYAYSKINPNYKNLLDVGTEDFYSSEIEKELAAENYLKKLLPLMPKYKPFNLTTIIGDYLSKNAEIDQREILQIQNEIENILKIEKLATPANNGYLFQLTSRGISFK